jgi:hypothetical protein
MKKILFIALSAISIVVAGLLVVACTPDAANTPDAQMHKMAQHSAPEQDSAAVWEAFFADVEALNDKYGSSGSVTGSRSIDDDLTTPYPNPNMPDIPGRDIIGALYGAQMSRNSNSQNYIFSLPMTVIPSLVYSYYAFKVASDDVEDNNDSIQAPTRITLGNIHTILDLTNSSVFVTLGKQHNRILSEMIASGFDSSNMSPRRVIQSFINKYNQVYSPISASLQNQLLDISVDANPTMDINVERSNRQFRVSTASMSPREMRDYTDEYLDIVSSSQVDSYAKVQMSINAAMAYYSGALWVIE